MQNVTTIYDHLLKFATLRPRSEWEIKSWFTRKKVGLEDQEKLLKRIKSFDLMDDLAFARWWVEQRTTFKPRGKKALESELTQKRVSKDIIHQVLSEADINEEKIASDLIAKFRYKWGRFEGLKRKQKMQAFLARKGLSWEVIDRVVVEDVE